MKMRDLKMMKVLQSLACDIEELCDTNIHKTTCLTSETNYVGPQGIVVLIHTQMNLHRVEVLFLPFEGKRA